MTAIIDTFVERAGEGKHDRLTPHDPEFERQAAIMRRVARKCWNVLRELAK